MLESFELLPADPILGLMAAFRADPHPRKVDLGIGIYRNDGGETPVLDVVRRAEQAMLARQNTKAYVAPIGNAEFNQAMERLVFGDHHPARSAGRIRSIQTPGGCGALRLGAELVHLASPDAVIHLSTPTWANHVPLLTGLGLQFQRYPYYDPATHEVNFGAMMETFERLPSRAVVLLHASCHNPTGADLTQSQWREVVALISRRGLVPFVDMAYQGLGDGVAEDAFGVRLLAAELPELLVAVSCSKNFGLYRERTGVLHIVSQTPSSADAALSQLVRIARTMYSMPPDHGAAIVREILSNDASHRSWLEEVDSMRSRISGLRREIVASLAKACPQRDFSFIERQRGMFSYLGVSADQVRALRERFHIYLTDDSRINIAGLRRDSVDYFADSVARVLAATK